MTTSPRAAGGGLLSLVVLLLLTGTPGPATATGGSGLALDDPATDYGRMLLVLDSSGSMAEPAAGGTTKIEAAKSALDDVISDLPGEAYVGLRVYRAEVFSKKQKGACQDSQLVVPPGVDNRDELASAVQEYEPFGETPIGYALQRAAEDIGAEGTRSIVLVSDGVATCEPDPCDVAAQLADQGIDLQIDVVGLSVDAEARNQLRCIAAKGGGTYYDADSADDIVESLSTVSERALRPFELEGTPIDGGTSLDPTPVGPGRWVDEIGTNGDDSERWFAVERTIPGSTLHVGVSSLGSGDDSWDSVKLSASLADGTSCGTDADLKQIISGQVVGTGVTVGAGSADVYDEECVSADEVLVSVSRALNGEELAAPFSLTVAEEPPLDATALPEPLKPYDAEYVLPEVGGEPEPVVGGSSFGEATEVTTGRWSGSLVPGETQVFRVHLDHGQALTARAVIPAASPTLREEIGIQGPFGGLALFNPFRMATDAVGDATPTGFAAQSSGSVLTVGTTEVRYRNREQAGNASYVAGDYYLVYAADDDGVGGTYEMPFTLEVEVLGEPSGAPEYDGGAELLLGSDSGVSATDVADPEASGEEPPTAGPEAEDGAGASDGADRDDLANASARQRAEDGSLTALLVAGLVTVAVACLGVGLALLRRGRA